VHAPGIVVRDGKADLLVDSPIKRGMAAEADHFAPLR
jgi:hypothetical protein